MMRLLFKATETDKEKEEDEEMEKASLAPKPPKPPQAPSAQDRESATRAFAAKHGSTGSATGHYTPTPVSPETQARYDALKEDRKQATLAFARQHHIIKALPFRLHFGKAVEVSDYPRTSPQGRVNPVKGYQRQTTYASTPELDALSHEQLNEMLHSLSFEIGEERAKHDPDTDIVARLKDRFQSVVSAMWKKHDRVTQTAPVAPAIVHELNEHLDSQGLRSCPLTRHGSECVLMHKGWLSLLFGKATAALAKPTLHFGQAHVEGSTTTNKTPKVVEIKDPTEHKAGKFPSVHPVICPKCGVSIGHGTVLQSPAGVAMSTGVEGATYINLHGPGPDGEEWCPGTNMRVGPTVKVADDKAAMKPRQKEIYA